jgi:hypothetical protein
MASGTATLLAPEAAGNAETDIGALWCSVHNLPILIFAYTHEGIDAGRRTGNL